jgi:antitoxin component YwqK of YwqJK toxin-antitoxin module
MTKQILFITFLIFSTLSSCSSQSKKSDDTFYEEFHENGKLKFKVQLVNGKKEGVGKTYFDNGDLKIESHYKNDVLNGSYIQHFHGRIIKEVTYQNDTLNGYSKHYYPNEKLREEGNYKSGLSDGVWKEYQEDGWLFYENTYVKGEKKGAYIRYLPNGQIEIKGNWLNRMLDSSHTYYDNNEPYKWTFYKVRNDSLHVLSGPSFAETQDPSFTILKQVDGYYYEVNKMKRKLNWTTKEDFILKN